MAEQDIMRIARDIVDAFNQSDWERTRAPLTPNSVYNELGAQRSLKGPNEIIEALQGWKQAMPDVKGTVTNCVASGNTVTLEVRWIPSVGQHWGDIKRESRRSCVGYQHLS